MKTTKEVLEIAMENSDNAKSAIDFLEDGAAMAALGITDEDQDSVEEASEILSGPIYSKGIQYINKTDDATTETRWFHVNGEVWGLCDDGRMLDEDGIPCSDEPTEIKEAIEEYINVAPSQFVRDCNSKEAIIDGLKDESTRTFHAASYLADAVLDDLNYLTHACCHTREENLAAQLEIFVDAGAVFDHKEAMALANRLLAAS